MTGGGRRTARSRTKSAADSGDANPSQSARPHLRRHRDRSKSDSFIGILNVNLKYVLGFSAAAFLIIFFTVNHLVKPAKEPKRPRVVTPFPAPKIMDLPQVTTILIDMLLCIVLPGLPSERAVDVRL